RYSEREWDEESFVEIKRYLGCRRKIFPIFEEKFFRGKKVRNRFKCLKEFNAPPFSSVQRAFPHFFS
ncbi:hypothetical protein NPIL_482411, partial [Nephila pilipes]